MIRQVFEKHPYWQEVREICLKLHHAGHTVYIAGGAVRDAIMGRPPHDIDIATDALPEKVLQIFPNARDVGKHFGVMIVPVDNVDSEEQVSFEIATFRSDGPYLDGRHPSTVTFTDARMDAERRDFTINALFFDPLTYEIHDYVNGLADIENKIIRAVGNPQLRFTEDKLRILRAVRFVSQLGFTLEQNTLKAAEELAAEIYVVSKERITDEMRKFCCGPHLKLALTLFRDTKLFSTVLPQLTFTTERDDLWQATLRSAPFLAATRTFSLFMGWMILQESFHRKTDIQTIRHFIEALPLRLTRDEIRLMEYLVRGFYSIQDGKKSAFLLLADERGPLLTELCSLAVVSGQIPEESVAKVIDEFLEVVNEEGALPAPLVRGDDLLALGFEPTTLKLALEDIYIKQLKYHETDREALLTMISNEFRNR